MQAPIVNPVETAVPTVKDGSGRADVLFDLAIFAKDGVQFKPERRLHRVERLLLEDAARTVSAQPFEYRIDGWRLVVSAKLVTPRKAACIQKSACGFLRYDWMVRSICDFGRIIEAPRPTEWSYW